MRQRMERISAKDARDHMAAILNHVFFGGKHYTLTRHGKDVAVIISLEEWKAAENLLQQLEDEEDIRDADAAMQRVKKGEKTITHQDMKNELGL